MGRLENIIARNRRPHGFRATLGMVWRGLFILFILVLLIFTDWALTDEEEAPARPRDPSEHRIEGVPLRRPAVRRTEQPAQQPARTEPPAQP